MRGTEGSAAFTGRDAAAAYELALTGAVLHAWWMHRPFPFCFAPFELLSYDGMQRPQQREGSRS